MKPKVLVLVGYGLNCEDETAYLYQNLGAEVDKVHVNDLLGNSSILEKYHILDLVGGFSDGDHIAAGRVHANRFRYGLQEELYRFIHDGKLIVGICNGFQALVKAGLLPGFAGDRSPQRVTLTYNRSGTFEDRWVRLAVNKNSNCVWTRNIDELYLPVRHGEGRFMAESQEVMERLNRGNQIVLRYIDPRSGKPTLEYPHNPNGSEDAVAGICDPTGRVFGMMTHRECFWSPYSHPNWVRLRIEGKMLKEGMGVQVSRNAVDYAIEKLV